MSRGLPLWCVHVLPVHVWFLASSICWECTTVSLIGFSKLLMRAIWRNQLNTETSCVSLCCNCSYEPAGTRRHRQWMETWLYKLLTNTNAHHTSVHFTVIHYLVHSVHQLIWVTKVWSKIHRFFVVVQQNVKKKLKVKIASAVAPV